MGSNSADLDDTTMHHWTAKGLILDVKYRSIITNTIVSSIESLSADENWVGGSPRADPCNKVFKVVINQLASTVPVSTIDT